MTGRTISIVLVLLAVLTGCTGSADTGQPPPAATASSGSPTVPYHYAALGDSFTAAPLVPTTDIADGCFRSDHNYPSLLAERLDVSDFTDVSCSGARTRDLVRRQHTFGAAVVKPQLDAVDVDTTLVTLGIGGNDEGLYGSVLSTCLQVRDQDPDGSPCRARITRQGGNVDAMTTRIGRHVERSLRQVAKRAPEARVVLVGYPRIVPPRGECPRRLPYATGDVAFADRVQRLLNRAMAGAADRAGAEFLDMYAASRGHDVCSDEPWVNGAQTDRTRAAAFHPFPRGMRAVARELAALVDQ